MCKDDWISVKDRLPDKVVDSVWSKDVVVWCLNTENEDEYFKESCIYNFLHKKWDGVNGLSGNYDEKVKALFWMSSESFENMVTPNGRACNV